MRVLLKATFVAFLLPCLANPVIAQPTPEFERLFNAANALTIQLNMTQAQWEAIANELPPAAPDNPNNFCYFALDPSVSRYSWHHANVTIAQQGLGGSSRIYADVGIKKRSFCGSRDQTKPSLNINIDKFNNANENPALAQLGVTNLLLGNSKQDHELFRQCAGYHVFRAMGMASPACTLVGVSRRAGTAAPVFLGVYVLVEAVKKDFFSRRDGLTNVRNGSLYEMEAFDDFDTNTLNSQLQVEWSATQNGDFAFAVNTLAARNPSALSTSIDVPSFTTLWATEIFLKHWDGYTKNRNNSYLFDDPPDNPITHTRFRFVPHGLDQIVNNPGTLPTIWKNSIPAQIAINDNLLRYHLLHTLSTMGSRVTAANVAGRINELTPLANSVWTQPDPILGSNSQVNAKAQAVRNDMQQAIVDLRTAFGTGHINPMTAISGKLIGAHH